MLSRRYNCSKDLKKPRGPNYHRHWGVVIRLYTTLYISSSSVSQSVYQFVLFFSNYDGFRSFICKNHCSFLEMLKKTNLKFHSKQIWSKWFWLTELKLLNELPDWSVISVIPAFSRLELQTFFNHHEMKQLYFFLNE